MQNSFKNNAWDIKKYFLNLLVNISTITSLLYLYEGNE